MILAAPGPTRAPLLPPAEELVAIGGRVAITIAVALLIRWLLYLLVGRFQKLVKRVGDERAEQRALTLGHIFNRVIAGLIGAFALIHILELFGWDVKPLLAGAGVVGIALGFGAQTVVRDMIAGGFILFEDQFGVGDLIEVNAKPATVEAMTLRYTRLRDFNGFVHFVPNGEMRIVTNRSRGWQRLAVDVPVATDQDVERALEVCGEVVRAMNADPAWHSRLIDPVDLWGLESLSSAEATIRIVIRARPGPDAPEASRALRQRLHKALAEAGVRFGASREIVLASPAAAPSGNLSGNVS